MTTEAGVEISAKLVDVVVKYFYFSWLDEQLSFSASLRVLTELKSRNWLNSSHRARWIQTISKWRQRSSRLKRRPWAHSAQDYGMVAPDNVDLGVWGSFLSSGEANEVEAVVLSRILGFSDDEIAEGLAVTPGTIRYRVGRGLRHLGGYLES